MNTKCACGCGGDIPPRSKNNPNRLAQFIQGHWSKTVAHHQMRAAMRQVPPEGWKAPSGLCECGCGQRTKIATITDVERGQYAGSPLRFTHGHNARGTPPEKTSNWKGGRYVDAEGYARVLIASPNRYRQEHMVVWERTHGPIPKGRIIHHINGNRLDNRLSNLLCLTRSQHMHLHHPTEHPEKFHVCPDCGAMHRIKRTPY